MQANVHGDLEAETMRRIKSAATPRPVDTRLRPGARIVREWQGRRYEVEVVEGGYLHASARFKNLTQIANQITGAHWSGPRFFGLTGKRPA